VPLALATLQDRGERLDEALFVPEDDR
jgi:hypothetical protein